MFDQPISKMYIQIWRNKTNFPARKYSIYIGLLFMINITILTKIWKSTNI